MLSPDRTKVRHVASFNLHSQNGILNPRQNKSYQILILIYYISAGVSLSTDILGSRPRYKLHRIIGGEQKTNVNKSHPPTQCNKYQSSLNRKMPKV